MQVEYTLKTGDFPEKELVKIIGNNLKRIAEGEPRIKNTKLKKKMNPTGQVSLEPDQQNFYEYVYWYKNRYLYNIF